MERVLRRVAPDISTWLSGAAATGHISGKIFAPTIEPGCSYLHCACYSSLTRIPHQCWLCFAWHSSSTQFLLARCSHRLMCWPAQASSVVSEHFSGVRVSRDAPGAHAAHEVIGAQWTGTVSGCMATAGAVCGSLVCKAVRCSLCESHVHPGSEKFG